LSNFERLKKIEIYLIYMRYFPDRCSELFDDRHAADVYCARTLPKK
jgi:hypothetical protein